MGWGVLWNKCGDSKICPLSSNCYPEREGLAVPVDFDSILRLIFCNWSCRIVPVEFIIFALTVRKHVIATATEVLSKNQFDDLSLPG